MPDSPQELFKRVDVDLYISQQIQQTEALASLAKSFESIAKTLQNFAQIIDYSGKTGHVVINIRQEQV